MVKKINIIMITLISFAALAYAQDAPTEEDYRNIDELRSRLVRMKKEMDRFVKDLVDTYPPQEGLSVAGFGDEVRVDVSETAKDVIVKADLPGMDKDKIEITLANNKILTIGGSRDIEKKQTAPGVVRQERMVGSFKRVLELPVECMNDGIKADYKNGVLELIIPKREPAKETKVKINVQ